VREEQVERADDLVLDAVDADDVVEPDIDLVGSVEHVRRPSEDDERHDHGQDQHDEEDHRQPQHQVDVRHAEQVERVAAEDAPPQNRRGRTHPDRNPDQPTPAELLAVAPHVGAGDGHDRLAVHGQ